MSGKNGKNGTPRKDQDGNKPARKENGQLLKGNTANPDGRPPGPNKMTRIMREALGKESVSFLKELRKLTRLEMNARSAGLGLFVDSVDDYYEALETLRDATSREDIKEIEKALRHVDSLVDDLKITLPSLESTKLYGSFMIRLLPQMKEVNVNIDERHLHLQMLLGLQGRDALAYLKGDLQLEDIKNGGSNGEEHNNND